MAKKAAFSCLFFARYSGVTMSIQIIWQAEVSGPKTQERLVLPHAQLLVTLVGNVIVESSWEPFNALRVSTETALIQQLRHFLSSPNAEKFQVKLYKQGTVYSQQVWQKLLDIPFGQVMCYSDLAYSLDSGPRAVAQACRANPYAGIIPCHRVVAKSGLGGFMGQSKGPLVQLKQQLLAYERQRLED
jgi:methylated-DNA-[protein]-cysteine S-methyltransferase